MKNLIRLPDYSVNEIKDIFKTSSEILKGKYKYILKKNSCNVFPNASIKNKDYILKRCIFAGWTNYVIPNKNN